MEFNTIKDAFDRVCKKQKLSSSKTCEVIDEIGHEIEQALLKLQSLPALEETSLSHKAVLEELHKKLIEIAPLSQLEGPQKDLNMVLSKYTKLIEKTFTPDIAKSYRNYEFDKQLVNQIVATHFYRQGLFDLGDCFVLEAGVPESSTLRSAYFEMYQVLEQMKLKNLEPALKWVVVQRDHLSQTGSLLELKLHRLQFLEILKKGDRNAALVYARTYLSPFASVHMSEIQKLMGCLLWAGRLDASPYADYLLTSQWDELAGELMRECCRLLGQSYESPLSVTISAGIQGLPTLLKLASVMAAKKQDWQSLKQLPVPVELGSEFQFHSIFVCPVSRDQASEENPPMLLPCGHVLCKQSVSKLSKSSTRSFKCPYCPMEASVAQCKQLYF